MKKKSEESSWGKATHWDKKDWDKFHKYEAKIQKEVNKVFGCDQEGVTIVEVELRNRAYHRPSNYIPIAKFDRLKTEEDWIDALRMASCNVNTASELVNQLLTIYSENKRRKKEMEEITKALDAHCRKLGFDGCFVTEGNTHKSYPSLEIGCKWYRPKIGAFGTQFMTIDQTIVELIQYINENIKLINDQIRLDVKRNCLVIIDGSTVRFYCEICNQLIPIDPTPRR